MTKAELIELVKAEPQAIWDILREAAILYEEGACTEVLHEHQSMLDCFLEESAVLRD